jgi:hypothetical protein
LSTWSRISIWALWRGRSCIHCSVDARILLRLDFLQSTDPISVLKRQRRRIGGQPVGDNPQRSRDAALGGGGFVEHGLHDDVARPQHDRQFPQAFGQPTPQQPFLVRSSRYFCKRVKRESNSRA